MFSPVASHQAESDALPRATLDRHVDRQAQDVPKILYLLKVNQADSRARLGHGAFGETWVGSLHSLHGEQKEKVAVKIPKGIENMRIDANAFRDEAMTLAQLALPAGVPHPYLIRFL
eukprot:1608255-Amphidinium_carterae.1